jgi:hypothetical protein
MRKLSRVFGPLLLFAAVLSLGQAQTPNLAHAHLKKGTTPPDVPIGKAAITQGVQFDKDMHEPFKVTWLSTNPCGNGPISDTNPVCVFITNVCPKVSPQCHFPYKTAAGDPEIIIDPGDNPPPPPSLEKFAKDAAAAGKARAAERAKAKARAPK